MKTLLCTTALALAVSPAALADEVRHGLQCNLMMKSSPGPKEIDQLSRLPKGVLEDSLKPMPMEFIYEFLPDGTVAASVIDKDVSGPVMLTLKTSSLVYSLTVPIDPSRPHDHSYASINRQTGALQGIGFMHNDTFNEDTMSTWTGQCHAITIPAPKL
jgi:hypothetical protein